MIIASMLMIMRNSKHYHKQLKPNKLSDEKEKSHREIYEEYYGVKIKNEYLL
jgi:hypothetical protein